MKVGIVAGEKSGDYLGSELIKAIKVRHPNATFVGLCGPQMQEQGAQTLAEMDKISIMGFEGVLANLKEILKIRNTIYKHMLSWNPDVFVGIDVPDFNLTLEKKLKTQGIPTVHYVSPTVWAWRGGRIKKIRKAVNLMLTLFPFEERYYQQNNVPVKFVGHPMAKQVMGWKTDEAFTAAYKVKDKTLVSVMPGSRISEVSKLAPVMLDASKFLSQSYPDLHFVIPAASDNIYQYLTNLLDVGHDHVKVIKGRSQDLLAICDLAILASGTAALESALFAKPMVVMYKVGRLNEFIARRTVTVDHYSMPNHLTSPPAVVELIQEQATVEKVVAEVTRILEDEPYRNAMQHALSEIAPILNRDSSQIACEAIESLLSARVEN